MLEIVNYSLVFAGLCGLFGGFYRFNTLEATRVRHHEHLVRYADAVAKATWFERVKSALRTISRWLDRVYGPPSATGSRFRDFMTNRAWRASATIVAFYLFILPLVAGVFLFAIWYYLPNETVKGIPQWARACIAVATVLVALLLVWLIVTRIRLQTRQETQAKPRLFDNLRLPLLVISIFIGPVELTTSFERSYILMAIGGTAALVSLFVYMYWLVITIWNFALRSPVIIGVGTFAVLISANMFMNISIPLKYYDPQMSQQAKLIWEQFPVSAAFSSIYSGIVIVSSCVYVLWTALEYFKIGTVTSLLTKAMWGVVVSIYLMSFVLDAAWADIDGLDAIALGAAGTILGAFAFAQFFLLVYTPIYSNSLPDSISMGFTRYCIRKCGNAIKASEMICFALVDCLVAIGCVLLSGLLFLAGGAAVYLVSETLSVLITFLGGDVTKGDLAILPQMSSAGQFFMTNVSAVYLSLFESVGIAHSIVLNDGYLSGAEFIRQLVMFFVFTALMPSALNLLVISATVCAHALARLSSSFAERVHSLLLEVDHRGEPVAIWRSTSLISIIGGSMLAFVLVVVEFSF